MNNLAAISLSGLRASIASFGAAASNIASMNSAGPAPAPRPSAPPISQPVSGSTAPYTPPSIDAETLPNIDLAEEMVRIAMAVQAFRANIAVMKAADQMAKSALDILS